MGVTGGDYTSWTYDARGRVLTEAKQVPGSGQQLTKYYLAGAARIALRK